MKNLLNNKNDFFGKNKIIYGNNLEILLIFNYITYININNIILRLYKFLKR